MLGSPPDVGSETGLTPSGSNTSPIWLQRPSLRTHNQRRSCSLASATEASSLTCNVGAPSPSIPPSGRGSQSDTDAAHAGAKPHGALAIAQHCLQVAVATVVLR